MKECSTPKPASCRRGNKVRLIRVVKSRCRVDAPFGFPFGQLGLCVYRGNPAAILQPFATRRSSRE